MVQYSAIFHTMIGSPASHMDGQALRAPPPCKHPYESLKWKLKLQLVDCQFLEIHCSILWTQLANTSICLDQHISHVV